MCSGDTKCLKYFVCFLYAIGKHQWGGRRRSISENDFASGIKKI